MKKILRNKSGITLVALLITIILLLILAFVTIQLIKQTNLLEFAQRAKKENDNKILEENTILNNFEKNINCYISSSRDERTSEIIKDAKISLEETNGKIIIKVNPVLSQNESNKAVYLFIILINGNCSKYSDSSLITLEYGEYLASTEYKFSGLLVDKKGKIFFTNEIIYKTSEKVYEKKLLEYPVVTANGVCNIGIYDANSQKIEKYEYDNSYGNTSNSLSIKIEGYDRDLNTSAVILNSVDTGYVDVDSSCVGKRIIIKGARNCFLSANSSSGRTLGSTKVTSDQGSDLIINVTDDIKKIYFTTQSRSLGNLYFKEITVED